MDDLDNLYREGMQPVYGGTNVSIILATIVLINMAVSHNVSNAYVDELLRYLSTILLLAEKSLPKSHYEAWKLICQLWLNYKIIHTCLKGYVFFHRDYKDLEKYPKPECRMSRYIALLDSIPTRVIQYFSLIPRFLRLFCFPTISRLLRFHSKNWNMEASIKKSIANNPTWKHIDNELD